MRRLLLVALLAVAGAAALLAAGGSDDREGGRVAATFDNAQFLVPGEDVKLGGVRIGRIESVELDHDLRARVVMDVDPRFTPFRADARCSIEPQSLIGERFVQCAPGTPSAGPLRVVGGLPTVPVAQTSAPVDLDLVLATFRGSRGERLQLLLNELGAGLAGRADDLNAIVRRANPALQETQRVLEVLETQRDRLAPLVADAERTVSELDRGRDRVAGFVTSARRATEVTARRRTEVRAAVAGLPPLLREWRPALARFGEVTRGADPVVRDLDAAAPELERLARTLGPAAAEGAPALDALAAAADRGRPAVTATRPVVRRLQRFAAQARPVGEALRVLSENARERGVLEGLTTFLFNATGVVSRFDTIAHIAVAEGIVNDCSLYATTKGRAECNGHFGGDVGGAPAKRQARRRPAAREQREGERPASPPPAGAPGGRAPQPSRPAPPSLKVPGLPPIELPALREGEDVGRAVDGLLDFLLAP